MSACLRRWDPPAHACLRSQRHGPQMKMLRSAARGRTSAQDFADDLGEGDGFEGEFDMSGFDTREIEDFVDERADGVLR